MEALIQALHRLGEALDEEGGPGESSPPEEGQALEARQRDLVARFVRLPEGAIRRRSRSVDRVLLHPLVGVFFQRPWWAPGLVLFGFYVLSFAAAIITGLVFKRVYPSQEAFVLELPPYRSPSLKTVVRRGWTSMLNFFVLLFSTGGNKTDFNSASACICVTIKDGPTNSPLFPFVTQPQPFYQRQEEEKKKEDELRLHR